MFQYIIFKSWTYIYILFLEEKARPFMVSSMAFGLWFKGYMREERANSFLILVKMITWAFTSIYHSFSQSKTSIICFVKAILDNNLWIITLFYLGHSQVCYVTNPGNRIDKALFPLNLYILTNVSSETGSPAGKFFTG